ncbi:hypothetical protein [Ewingella americana]|uniref:hypothetical protein n=1 Tax=Ewingella americana TaxID=41202 RepID=UPI00191FF946|nr:hypothetical protein [Ewingella americana]
MQMLGSVINVAGTVAGGTNDDGPRANKILARVLPKPREIPVINQTLGGNVVELFINQTSFD